MCSPIGKWNFDNKTEQNIATEWTPLSVYSFQYLSAKGREEFGEKYGPLVVGSITLSNIIVLLSIGIVSNAILTDKIGSYLTYFLVMAVGPVIALVCVALFPNSDKDKKNWKNMKKCSRKPDEDGPEEVEIKTTEN